MLYKSSINLKQTNMYLKGIFISSKQMTKAVLNRVVSKSKFKHILPFVVYRNLSVYKQMELILIIINLVTSVHFNDT